MNGTKLDKKLFSRIMIILGIIVTIFIVIFIIKLITGNKLSYSDIEKKMIESAKNYYHENEDSLPNQNGGTTSITVDELVKADVIKPLNQLIKDKNVTCTGKITVSNNNGQYLYSPYLDCGDTYTTKTLASVLIDPNNLVSSGDGLYMLGDSYIYRGEKVNNYLSFAGKTWYILKIYGDGSIRILETTKRNKIVWDNRYNSDSKGNNGINNYSISRIKDSIDEIYNNPEEFSNKDKAYILNKTLCVGARSESDTINTGSIECSETFESAPLGLLQVNEYMLASIDSKCHSIKDRECTNYNYLAKIPHSFWTITKDSETTHKVYKISSSPFLTKASNSASILLTTTINGNVVYKSGDGSLEKPYTFN